ncbi:MAG: acetamidase/formamidase family protein [Firmicutes bacterium]|nr:acetamidase/formamidase family protein [Bacillota bacterium]
MLYIKKEQSVNRFDKENEPVLKCSLPAEITFETNDSFAGQVKSEDDSMDSFDYDIINPCTGPVYFEGVKPGDVLEIKIESIKCKSPGWAMCVPNEGVIGHLVKKSVTKIYHFEDKILHISDKIKVPVEPMIGVIGVAPAEGSLRAILPGDHGGNMDNNMIKEGATVYLPVNVEGGLLAIGDLHVRMGDGESFYTGIEVGGEVKVTVNVRRDLKMDIPFVKYNGRFASAATDETVVQATTKAMEKLVNFIVDNGELDFYEAGFLCGACAHMEVCQVVDPHKTMRMAIELDVLKQAGIDL